MRGRLAGSGDHGDHGGGGAGLKGSPSLYLLKIRSRLHLNHSPAARRLSRPANGTRAALARDYERRLIPGVDLRAYDPPPVNTYRSIGGKRGRVRFELRATWGRIDGKIDPPWQRRLPAGLI